MAEPLDFRIPLFDYRSLFFVSGTVGGVLLLFLAIQIRKSYPGFVRVIAGMEILAVAVVIAVLRGYVPDSLLAVQVTVIGAFALVDSGLRLFCGVSRRRRWPSIYVLASMLLLTYVFFTQPFGPRIVLTSLLVIPIFIDIALPLLGPPPQGCAFGYRFTLAILMLFCVAACLRITAVGLVSREAFPYFAATPVNNGFFLLVLFLQVAFAFGFIAMTYQRLVTELKITHTRVLAEIEERRKVERMAATGRFAWSLAHEINNPLASVVNSFYLLETHPALDDKALGFVRLGATELDRVARIVHQMLSYNRTDVEPHDLDVSEVVHDSLTIFADRFQRAGISLKHKIYPSSFAFGVSDEIRQVVDNLLLNAEEAMPQGGQMAISVSPRRDWNDPRQNGVRITIADSGPGIPREIRSQIFQAFCTTKPEKGRGLGLWVTRGILAKHGGTIRFKTSHAGQRSGTAFSIFLPSHLIAKVDERAGLKTAA